MRADPILLQPLSHLMVSSRSGPAIFGNSQSDCCDWWILYRCWTWLVGRCHVTLLTGRSRLCSRRRRPWRSTCRWGGRGSRSTWDSESATSDLELWGWNGRRSAPRNRCTPEPQLHDAQKTDNISIWPQTFNMFRFPSPLAPTVATWVPLTSILCQTGLSRHL